MTIIQKFEPEEKKSFINRKYIFGIVAILLILVLVEIWLSNSLAIYGKKLEKLADTTRKLGLQNQILQNEIAKGKSLTGIASKSAELGFSYPGSIKYIR